MRKILASLISLIASVSLWADIDREKIEGDIRGAYLVLIADVHNGSGLNPSHVVFYRGKNKNETVFDKSISDITSETLLKECALAVSGTEVFSFRDGRYCMILGKTEQGGTEMLGFIDEHDDVHLGKGIRISLSTISAITRHE